MSKIYGALAIVIAMAVSVAMGFFISSAMQLRNSLEEDPITSSIIGIADVDIADNSQADISQIDCIDCIDCNYSEWQKAIDERDNTIKQLNQDSVEFHEINKGWVEAEKQWIADRATLEQEITTWEKGSTSLLKLFQQNTLDGIAKTLIDLTYNQSAYNVLLHIAPTQLEQDLLLKQLTTNAYFACQSLNTYVQTGMITAVPEYGEQCQKVEELFNSLKE